MRECPRGLVTVKLNKRERERPRVVRDVLFSLLCGLFFECIVLGQLNKWLKNSMYE